MPAGSEGIPIILGSQRLELFMAVAVMVEVVAVGLCSLVGPAGPNKLSPLQTRAYLSIDS